MGIFVSSGTDVLKVESAGQIKGAERAVTGVAAGWDLSEGNNWSIGAVAVPQPTNGVSGQSGTVRVTTQPTSWPVGGALKYPAGTAPVLTAYPAVFPFYVVDANNVLLGYATEGVS